MSGTAFPLASHRMKERDFIAYVIDVARRHRWRVYHVPAPMRHTASGWVGAKEGAGLPDLILLHDDPPCLLFAEVKGTRGELTDEQTEFLRLARGVAEAVHDLDGAYPLVLVGAYAWRPGDEDALEAVLRSKVLR